MRMPSKKSSGPANGSEPISKYPDQCMVDGCEEETAVTIARVITPNGKHTCVQPSQALEDHSAGGEWNCTLRPGYGWKHWITRCARCYSMDMARFARQRRRA